MRSGCDVMRNLFSVCPQMAGKANPHPEQSWAVGARDDGDRRCCGGAFPDLSALISCCNPDHLAGFGATLDSSTPLVSVLSQLLPVGVLDPKGLSSLGSKVARGTPNRVNHYCYCHYHYHNHYYCH